VTYRFPREDSEELTGEALCRVQHVGAPTVWPTARCGINKGVKLDDAYSTLTRPFAECEVERFHGLGCTSVWVDGSDNENGSDCFHLHAVCLNVCKPRFNGTSLLNVVGADGSNNNVWRE